ncbi:MAG: hypothetical protein IJA65_02590 [Acholeplasmatales bacterium]|nr:hypothetical protein [Acholeplasmatales bacterium]
MAEVKEKCGNCGRVSYHEEKEQSFSIGSCDLDTRPAPPIRYLIGEDIQVCPHCGYVHTKLSSKIKGSATILESEEFKEIDKKGFPKEAANYLKAAYLIRDNEDKFYHYLSAAWVCDDKSEDDLAIVAREYAIEIGKKMKDVSTDFHLIMIDLYRRTKRFKEASELCDKLGSLSGTFGAIVKFQRKLLKKKDSLSYNMKEAMEYGQKETD